MPGLSATNASGPALSRDVGARQATLASCPVSLSPESEATAGVAAHLTMKGEADE